jgi:hypothetical protein
MTVHALPYTARGAAIGAADFRRYLAEKAALRGAPDRRAGGIGNAMMIVAAFWAIIALSVWGISL